MSEEVYDENERFVLTEAAVVQLALKDFNIDVSVPMADAIYKNIMKMLCKQGYVREVTTDEKSE